MTIMTKTNENLRENIRADYNFDLQKGNIPLSGFHMLITVTKADEKCLSWKSQPFIPIRLHLLTLLNPKKHSPRK